MKVRCINNSAWEKLLTINKIYDVLYENDYEYKIKNNNEKECIYLKNRFVIVEEKKDNEMNKYKIYEVLKMIEENKDLKFTDDIYDVFWDKDANVVRILNKTNCKVNIKCLGLEREFYLIKQSVTFEEVLNLDKMCRVEHKLIKKICETDISMDYEKFDNLMYFLSNCLNEGELKEIIKNGKWYLED